MIPKPQSLRDPKQKVISSELIQALAYAVPFLHKMTWLTFQPRTINQQCAQTLRIKIYLDRLHRLKRPKPSVFSTGECHFLQSRPGFSSSVLKCKDSKRSLNNQMCISFVEESYTSVSLIITDFYKLRKSQLQVLEIICYISPHPILPQNL